MKTSGLLCLLIGIWGLQESFASDNATTIPELHSNVSEIYVEEEELSKNDEAIRRGADYMLSKRNPSDYGWGADTHRAITTLVLSDALFTSDQDNLEEKLMVKELELKLALALAKQHQEDLSSGQLALYINALLAVCINPRDFYGLNLVSKLYHRDEEHQLAYPYALQSLALCNAGASYDKARILKLVDAIKNYPGDHGGLIDNLAMTTLALACGLKYHPTPSMERYLNRAVKKLKNAQRPDGSFGNIYSTGITLQALQFTNTNGNNWNESLAIENILSQQKEDGSFVDFMGTYFSLPPLMNKTLASLANWSCGSTETTDKDSLVTTVAPEYVGANISIGLQIRAPEIQEYRVGLKGFQNESLYTIIKANQETIYVEFKDTSFGHMIVGVDGLNQDTANGKYWMIYVVDKDKQEHLATTGVDGLYPGDGDNYVFKLQKF